MQRHLLLVFSTMLIFSSTGHCRDKADKAIDDLFNEYSKTENADYTYINPFMMKMAMICAIFTGDSDTKAVRKVKSVKVLDIEGPTDENTKSLIDRISSLQDSGYDELSRSNDDGDITRVFTKIKGNAIRRLVVLNIDGSECSLVSIDGKFDKNDINSVINDTAKNRNGCK